jgi:hypothetical protein
VIDTTTPQEVRGVVCGVCNIRIGHFDNDPARLVHTAAYLRRVQR